MSGCGSAFLGAAGLKKGAMVAGVTRLAYANTVTDKGDPLTLDTLGARERQIMSVVYRLGRATVRDVLNALPDSPNYSSVRTMLNKLEEKGHLEHREEGRRYVYAPTLSPGKAQRSTLREVVRNLFGGSAAKAMTALLDLDDSLTPAELQEVEEKIRALKTVDR